MNIIDGPGGIHYTHKHHSVLHMCSRNIRLYTCTMVCQRLTYKPCIMSALLLLAILLVATSEHIHDKPHMSNCDLWLLCSADNPANANPIGLQKGPTAKMVDRYVSLVNVTGALVSNGIAMCSRVTYGQVTWTTIFAHFHGHTVNIYCHSS